MIPRKVVLENFLSFGTPAATVEFSADEPLWVLCGPNGVGKSAVFDAITYALFGCHRGTDRKDKDKKGQLVRHGANGFRVEFEFQVGRRAFKVQRSHGKNSVERVFRDAAGEWVEVDLPAGVNRVREWAEAELGLTYDQFTASVLLRQGEADRIILATGKDRLDMLKKVIGVERFEALSGRVKKAANEADDRKRRATEKVGGVPVVAPDEFAAAVTAEREAVTGSEAARDAEADAVGRVAQAAEFTRLSKEVADLTRLLDAAAVRRAAADRIRTGHTRLGDLDAAVPTLAKLVPARDERARLAPERDRLTAEADIGENAVRTATADRDRHREAATTHKLRADEAANALKECEAARTADAAALKVAEEVEGIDRELTGFPADLDDQFHAAAEERTAARAAAAEARDAHVAARTVLKQREKELADFGAVEAGATCSRCRQPVTAEHAAAERQALADEIARLEVAKTSASAAEAATKARQTAAEAGHDRLDTHRRERDKLSQKRLGLTSYAVETPAAELRDRLAARAAETTRHTTAAADERAKAKVAAAAATAAEAARAAADAKLTTTRVRLSEVRDQAVKAESTVAALLGTLTGDWPDRWEALSTADVAALAAERDGLRAAGVEADFRALGDDAALDAERSKQRAAATAAIDAIPDAARITVVVAEVAAKAARAATALAAAALAAATAGLKALHDRREERDRLLAAEKAAEADARVHAKLNRHLGADGMQRELVRSAERQIVRFADETVRHLSDGDLSVELDDAEEGPDKAFTLKVRRAENPVPIGVAYLSGSQKFRVAVAVALGIGRFATSGTQARPLESVIIDEGFGSLDKDGLRCMADELHRLKDKLALKRVILVSHQEAFTDRFPVGYHLAPGDAGTTATPFRRY